MTKKTSINGHWGYGGVLDPDTFFGFVYLITNDKTGRMYVGKKQYHSWPRGKKGKEKAWRGYTGSSKELNADIKKLGKKNFTFSVIKEYKTKGWLSYGECNWQHKLDVLTQQLEDVGKDGKPIRAYYNKAILAIRWVPQPHFHPEECQINNMKDKI